MFESSIPDMILKEIGKTYARAHIFQYALVWAGSMMAIVDKFPLNKYPAPEPLQFQQVISYQHTKDLKTEFPVLATIAIEDDKVVMNIDWQDGTPKEVHSGSIPLITIDLPLGLSSILEQYKFEFLELGR